MDKIADILKKVEPAMTEFVSAFNAESEIAKSKLEGNLSLVRTLERAFRELIQNSIGEVSRLEGILESKRREVVMESKLKEEAISSKNEEVGRLDRLIHDKLSLLKELDWKIDKTSKAYDSINSKKSQAEERLMVLTEEIMELSKKKKAITSKQK